MATCFINFTAADDTKVEFKGARPGRLDVIAIGMEFYNAPTIEAEDEVIERYDAILVRRGLRAFANYANRTGQKDVAKAAMEMRDEIVLERGAHDDEDVA